MSSTLQVDVLSPKDAATDAELDAFFDACPTSFAQQTRAWRDVITGIDADEPMYLGGRQGARLIGVLPAYRFDGPLGAILTSVPQAGPLGGVACLPDADPEPVYAALLRAFVALAERTGVALATVIGNPLWPDGDLIRRHLRAELELTNTCQVLDLESALDAEGQLVAPGENLRRNLRRALAGDFRIDEEQSRANLETWYEIHAARHRHIGATPLPKTLFTGALEHMIPCGKARFFFVRLASTGEMVAGGFYVHHQRVIDALMPSVSTEHANLGPNFLLAMHTMRWARERGYRYYNWQPSPPDSGVHRFKLQWGSRDVDYGYFTRITGDAEPFFRSTPDAIRSGYPWHYALPFDRLGTATAKSSPSSRRAAWNAAEIRR